MAYSNAKYPEPRVEVWSQQASEINISCNNKSIKISPRDSYRKQLGSMRRALKSHL